MAKRTASNEVRLNKLIADSGLASRRQADKIIEEGRVTINGKKVYELGIRVNPEEDNILVDQKPIKAVSMKLYCLLNKPKGVLTTMEDPLERPTIKEFLGKVPVRVFPIGRLDWDSEGLLLLTNDGEFANKIMHPKSEITKTYLVKIDGMLTDTQTQKLLNGVTIVGGKVKAKHLEKVKRGKDKNGWYKIVITEGKNRQIRQMFEKVGFDVLKLQRVAIGRLTLGNVPRGELVFINELHLNKVFQPDVPHYYEEIKKQKRLQSAKKQLSKKPSAKKYFKGIRVES